MKKSLSFIIVLCVLCANLFTGAPVTSAYARTTGINWVTSQNTNRLSTFTYTKKSYFGASREGNIFKSSDGYRWTTLTKQSVAMGVYFLSSTKDLLVLGARDKLMTSLDGIKWSTVKTPKIWPQQINTENGIFMVAAQQGQSYVYTSKDGLKWNSVKTNGMSFPVRLVYGAKKYVMSGYSNNGMPQVWDGKKWTSGSVTKNVNVKCDIYGNTKITKDVFIQLTDIAFGNGKFVALGSIRNGNYYKSIVALSTDGLKWSILSPTEEKNIQLSVIAFGNGKFVLSGEDGLILSSQDGLKWVKEDSGIKEPIYNGTFVNGQFIFTSYSSILVKK